MSTERSFIDSAIPNITIHRDTPVPSPRRFCTNKRVEMLRNCEPDLWRISNNKQQQTIIDSNRNVDAETSIHRSSPCPDSDLNNPNNNRSEDFYQKIISAPNSPRSYRCSPSKTHVTNFRNKNVPSTELMRRKAIPETSPVRGIVRSANVTFATKTSIKCIASDSSDSSDGDEKVSVVLSANKTTSISFERPQTNGIKRNHGEEFLQQNIKTSLVNGRDNISKYKKPTGIAYSPTPVRKVPIEFGCCPQSEPLKRKIYSEEAFPRSADMESG